MSGSARAALPGTYFHPTLCIGRVEEVMEVKGVEGGCNYRVPMVHLYFMKVSPSGKVTFDEDFA